MCINQYVLMDDDDFYEPRNLLEKYFYILKNNLLSLYIWRY